MKINNLESVSVPSDELKNEIINSCKSGFFPQQMLGDFILNNSRGIF